MNKSVLITGGAKRIGKAIASHLHEDGWDIILHFRSSADSALKIKKDFNAKRDNSCEIFQANLCLLYTSPSPRDRQKSRMPSSG